MQEDYKYLGYKITIGTGGDPLWVFKCTKCGHKKYSVFKKLQDPSHNCKEKTNEYGTSNQLSGTETDSDAEGDI